MELTLTTIISFVGAVLSALLAGIFAFIGSRYAAKAQINTTAQNAFISARLNAFRLYEEASKEKSIASCAAVYRAENTVRLVASDETIRTLGTLTAYVRLYETTKAAQSLDDITSAHAAALLSMRNDLLHYPIPSPDSTHKK